jgi:ATP phosphoribosyltransferase regulatory subunit
MTRAPSFANALQTFMAARNTAAVTTPVIQPAAPFLDMAGEDLRRRIFLTESETGETLCLRPEFTIPVCLDHIANGADTPARYAYLGEVFRQRRVGGSEFFQAGIEDLGDADIASADARSLTEATAMVRLAAPGADLEILLGDQTIFEAVLKALGLPRGWRMRLARTFGNALQLNETLNALSGERPLPDLGADMAKLAAKGDQARLAAAIAGEMQSVGFPAHAGRSPEDIALRLIEKTELAAVKLTKRQFAALREFLAIREPLNMASDHLRMFSISAGIKLDGALDAFSGRVARIKALGLSPKEVTYDAAFGRPLDYYTGLVFEIRERDPASAEQSEKLKGGADKLAPASAEQSEKLKGGADKLAPASGGQSEELKGEADKPALAGGGRYDRLLTLLGAEKPIPGVGFSLWLDRLEALA